VLLLMQACVPHEHCSVAHAITGFDLSVGFNNRLEIGDGRSENAPDRGLLAMSGQQQQPEATNSGQ